MNWYKRHKLALGPANVGPAKINPMQMQDYHTNMSQENTALQKQIEEKEQQTSDNTAKIAQLQADSTANPAKAATNANEITRLTNLNKTLATDTKSLNDQMKMNLDFQGETSIQNEGRKAQPVQQYQGDPTIQNINQKSTWTNPFANKGPRQQPA